jgi:hypothetical protein
MHLLPVSSSRDRMLPAALCLAALFVVTSPLRAAATAEPVTSAAPPSPWFAEFSAGLSVIPAGDVTLGGRTYEGDFKDGPFLRGAVGRRFGANWTVAGEWFYRKNELGSLDAGDRRFTRGDVASNSLFLSATYTAGPRFSWQGIEPYAGLGFGWIQELDLDLQGPDGGGFESGSFPAWQWSLGLKRPLAARAELFLEGRAVAAGERELQGPGGRRLRIAYDAWGLLAGLRWSF